MARNGVLLVFIGALFARVDCLKITNLYVPRNAAHDAHLDCHYDLEGDTLYDVKWYKDDKQFFRCIADGTVQEFFVDGVSIYYSNYVAKGTCPVTLTGLTASSTGEYKCEVTSDAPMFKSDSAFKILKVSVRGSTAKKTEMDNEIERNSRKYF
ncbi:uncharacterized protein LOC132698736 isoform X2 [Cylas formicarius]|uniref:uncharacterized protein LOC132698736 isoform X2 n=1 Tax=Cylas formicarius TaxID=197179 RepID=UPI0029585953|nr:uncharacterized protein LOC132698736 isoform X2 [Cylas formicarius]